MTADPILCRVASCPKTAERLGLCPRHLETERLTAPRPPTLFDEEPKE